MFRGSTRRRGGTKTVVSNSRFVAGTKNLFQSVNKISSTVPAIRSQLSQATVDTVFQQELDCTNIITEYNELKTEITALRDVFANVNTDIDDVLTDLS